MQPEIAGSDCRMFLSELAEFGTLLKFHLITLARRVPAAGFFFSDSRRAQAGQHDSGTSPLIVLMFRRFGLL
jgi:hypothetical protein